MPLEEGVALKGQACARLKRIGAETALRDKQWATLTVGFLNDEIDHHEGVTIRFVATKERDKTLRQLEQAARLSAISVLQAALTSLSEASVEELEERQAAVEQDAA